ncbi:MAG TPA: HAMP domain-containing sensor histidine kinase [Burkholderiales bacterium]|nr:HAMP domain-containing sensor histidine kinase [Burkholderiales bacterium]
MPRLNMRLRIALAFATLCIAVVGALGLTLYTAADDMEEALIDQIVTEEADSLIEHFRNDADYRPETGRNFAYYVARSAEEAAQLPRDVAVLPVGNHELRIGGEERHVAVRDTDGARLIVVYDVGAHEAREQQFRKLLLLSLASVVIIALFLGYWLAGILTRQLTELAQRVTQLAPDDLAHPPLVRPEQDAEVAALARALDDYQSRMMRMIRHEQDFTANASHELRTPLTAIHTSCELLLGDLALPEKARTRVQMIDQAARRMAEQLQTLLFVAREQGLDVSENVALAECVSDAAEPFRAEIGRKGIVLDVRIDRTTALTVNRQALHTVLANLIRNAVEHTERGFIHVSYLAHRLVVTDSGSGIAAAHLPHLFERYYRGEDRGSGLGLGLAIVKRICDQYGWRLEVTSEPGRGSDFAIVFLE